MIGSRLLALALILPLLGCSADGSEDRTLQVLAASSLTDAFGSLAEEFESQHPGVEVDLLVGSSTELAESAADGAPGDVLATADRTAMQVAQDAGVTVDSPRPFARNELVIVTPQGNPARVRSLADLDGTTWVRCADDVPCGRVALTLLEDAGVDADPASLEVDVRATLEKVATGEADAGLVYASDAVSADDAVEAVPIPGAARAPAVYQVVRLEQSGHEALAEAWVELVTSPDGRSALEDAGFTTP